MSNIKKVLSLVLVLVMVLGVSATRVQAATGEGTATINGGTNVSFKISSSNTITVVLTVGVTGIAIDADSPTFTVPTGFTTPDASPVANAGLVVADGNWSATAAGGTCAVTMGSSSATGQVMTVDVTGACATTNTITLTYKGSAPSTTLSATNFDVKTDDAIGGGAAASITTTPAHTVTAYHNIIQQPAQLVITTIATPAIPADTSITPATPATPATPTTPEVVCSPGQMFRATDGAKCTSNTSSTQVFCPPGQMFNGTTGERCNTVINAGAPGASGYTFGSGVIKLGTKGEACRAWQHFFNDKAGASLVADGWCGKLTIAVAKAWQKSMGLVSDGLLGAMSRGKANQQ